jgi:hypothetical protein
MIEGYTHMGDARGCHKCIQCAKQAQRGSYLATAGRLPGGRAEVVSEELIGSIYKVKFHSESIVSNVLLRLRLAILFATVQPCKPR